MREGGSLDKPGKASKENMSAIPVLLIDAGSKLCSSPKRLLTIDGLVVTGGHNADSGIERAFRNEYALTISDLSPHGEDDRKVLCRIRAASQVTVIVVTARA
jgi:DNA-binding response OmpR family regulator